MRGETPRRGGSPQCRLRRAMWTSCRPCCAAWQPCSASRGVMYQRDRSWLVWPERAASLRRPACAQRRTSDCADASCTERRWTTFLPSPCPACCSCATIVPVCCSRSEATARKSSFPRTARPFAWFPRRNWGRNTPAMPCSPRRRSRRTNARRLCAFPVGHAGSGTCSDTTPLSIAMWRSPA